MRRNSADGFTLAEMLVSMVVFLFLLMALYSVLTQSQWLRFRNDRRVNIQNNARIALELMTRDFRMIGCGIPTGFQVNGAARWTPAIFYATDTALGFRAEIDNGHTVLTRSATSAGGGTDRLYVEDARYYASAARCGGSAWPLLVVANRKRWEPVYCVGVDPLRHILFITPGVTDGVFQAARSEVVTVEQVYYWYAPNPDYPFGTLYRQARTVFLPDDGFPPANPDGSTLATHVSALSFQYLDAQGNPLGPTPLDTAQRTRVARIVITLVATDRAGPMQALQSIRLRTEVRLRNEPR
ncbi:MAG: prepilin-type N-terminal cleavage/methylation domain-containing protein [Acidobacteria bacterium]|nr:prepilin-type N-terminal cleavage/methylation domain-containing protein [Acidobacteriota bacterium]MDW7984656.1 prepilin-type N-terminal cleavage/methylation domain-containing protein [Acidobacteriota bacterium]